MKDRSVASSELRDIAALLARVHSNSLTPTDEDLLRDLILFNRVTPAKGERSVSIDGSVSSSTINTGNIEISLNDAAAIEVAFARYDQRNKYTHRAGLLVFSLTIAFFAWLYGIDSFVTLLRHLPSRLLSFPATFINVLFYSHEEALRAFAALSSHSVPSLQINAVSFFIIAYFCSLAFSAIDTFAKRLWFLLGNADHLQSLASLHNEPLEMLKLLFCFFSGWLQRLCTQAIGGFVAYIHLLFWTSMSFSYVAYNLGVRVPWDLAYVTSLYRTGVVLCWTGGNLIGLHLIFGIFDPELYKNYRIDQSLKGLRAYKRPAWRIYFVFMIVSTIGMIWWFFKQWNILPLMPYVDMSSNPDVSYIPHLYYGMVVVQLVVLFAPRIVFGASGRK